MNYLKSAWNHTVREHPVASGMMKSGGMFVFAGALMLGLAIAVPALGVAVATAATVHAALSLTLAGSIMLSVGSFTAGLATPRSLRKIKETNMAGQKVKGPRWALRELEFFQQSILDVTSQFNAAAALPSAAQRHVGLLIEQSSDALSHVKVLKAGNLGAPKDGYQFVKRHP